MSTPNIDPRRSMLLLLDMQPSVLDRFEGSDDLVNRLAGTIATARDKGMKVGYVRIAFNDLDYNRLPKHDDRLTDIANNRLMYDGDPSTQVHPTLEPQMGDTLVRKTRIGAFSTTDLDKKLRMSSRDTLVLAGVLTSGVVLSTLLEAADRDFKLFVLKDGCLDTNQELHETLMAQLFPRYASVIEVSEFEGLCKSALG
ncbi:cysteine hydrolase [bacterium]|nr:cysteine hydrolase [bacterium]